MAHLPKIWFDNLKELLDLINVNKDIPYDIMDQDLSYITVRINTRTNEYVLCDVNGEPIEPEKVKEAITNYKAYIEMSR